MLKILEHNAKLLALEYFSPANKILAGPSELFPTCDWFSYDKPLCVVLQTRRTESRGLEGRIICRSRPGSRASCRSFANRRYSFFMADRDFEDRDTSWVRTAKDLFSGAAGGVAQVLLGNFRRYSLSLEFSLRRVCELPKKLRFRLCLSRPYIRGRWCLRRKS